MKNLIRLEEVAIFCLSIFLFSLLNYNWWLFPLLLLLPDLAMAGYLADPKTGAVLYNIFHHRGISLAVYIVGALIDQQILQLLGVILFAHSTLDRIFDFGLKYADDFKHTHLS